MKLFLLMISFLITSSTLGQSKKKEKLYEKRQQIDLGALLIDGELVSPGDFSVDDEKERATGLLFKRENYNDRLRINIEYIF